MRTPYDSDEIDDLRKSIATMQKQLNQLADITRDGFKALNEMTELQQKRIEQLEGRQSNVRHVTI